MLGIGDIVARQATRVAKNGFREALYRSLGVGVVLFFFGAAFLFVMLALFFALRESVGNIGAALIVAAILVVGGLIALYVATRKAKRAKKVRKANASALSTEFTAATTLASIVMKEGKLALPLAGLVIGYLVATRGGGGDDDET